MSKKKKTQRSAKENNNIPVKPAVDTTIDEHQEEIIVWKSLMIVATLVMLFYVFVLYYTGKW